MPGTSASLLLITVSVFVSVVLLALGAMRALSQRGRVRRRYDSLAADAAVDPMVAERPWITIDPARLGVDAGAQRALRSDLVRAGFFQTSAVSSYVAIRLAILLALPILGVLVVPLAFGTWGLTERIALAGILVAVAYSLPKAYLSRRQARLQADYRVTFPDFLDMLVVCINAGLSLEAALDRATRELDEGDPEFRANLDLMAAEMRAGKSTTEALKALADRLGFREARSFAGLLQQTLELGTDVAQALTTFSDEMRDKRMSTAEEKAAALPPKLTIPLGLFIFPVVLIAVLAPAVLKLMHAVGR